MRCTKCGTESTTGRKFCPACGGPLSSRCPKCGAENAPASTFCEDCGTALTVKTAPAATHSPQTGSTAPNIRVTPEQPGASPAIDGERKTVTALFADIKGSTELEQDLDPEEARAIVDPALKLMIDAAHRYDGYVVQSTGDGIFALFGAPLAHEDHPQRALYCALRMQEDLRRYGAKLQAEGRAPVEIRIGVNTGEVVVRSIATGATQVEYSPIGHTTNLASRLQSIARTGSIVASEATRKFCEGYFILKPLGPTKVKGVSEPVNVYEVTGLGPLRTRLQRSAGRGYTKFVGRNREMDAMKAAAEQAQAGHGQIVAAMAEAGVGKSRLIFEFKVVSQSGWMVLETFSVSHGKASAFLPVIDLLHGYFDIKSEDDTRKRREKVTGRVLALDRSLEDALSYLFALLGLIEADDPLIQVSAEVRKRRTLDAIKRILIRESLNQPLMVIFEDLHWIDEETQALLNLLADSIGTAKILLLVNYRPEYSHQWGSKTYYTQLRLDPLGKESAAEMLQSLLGDSAELGPLKRLIIEKTEGNPFFMEETVEVLLDDGALVRNGGIKLVKPLVELKIPPTVQDILASRIDRLPPAEKDLLQTLAVIGREFAFGLLQRVVGRSEDELNRMLSDLQLAEFIYEQPALSDIEYTFKHALTQEVAYNSILIERRRAIHERVGNAIEALFAGRIEERLAELAHHYSRTSNIQKAVHFLKRAAEQAAEHSALPEAEKGIHDAIALLMVLPGSSERDHLELELQTALSAFLVGRSWGAPEREQPLRRAYELCERIGDPQQVLPALFQLDQLYIEQMRLKEAREVAERAVALAQTAADPILQSGAWHNLAETYYWPGDVQTARVHAQRAIALCENIPPQALIRSCGFDQWILTAGFVSFIHVILGRPEQGVHLERRVVERARSSSHPYSKALGMMLAGLSAQVRGDRKLAGEYVAPARQICDEYGFHEISGFAGHIAGWAHFWQGERVLGTAEMKEATEKMPSLGSLNTSSWRLALLAEARIELGEYQAAEATCAEAFDLIKQTNEGWCQPEIHRVAAEAILRKPGGDQGAAEERLHQAIQLARNQSAKWWELRATISLARLLAKTGRRVEARAMLAEIYNWFTEGFDTGDLKDAKALLEELSE
jgi:class 3 adenylate cyclase/tetratricopeptide (TPR) repeat protein